MQTLLTWNWTASTSDTVTSSRRIGVASMANFHHSTAPRRHVLPPQRLQITNYQ